MPRHRLHRGHVDRVKVRAFLAVDLDVHEEPIHDFGNLLILERFPLHDVAPVACRVTDAEEYRFVGRFRLR